MSAKWPPCYAAIMGFRAQRLVRLYSNPLLRGGLGEYYGNRGARGVIDFIKHWGTTYDPRNAGSRDLATTMPFILFDRQEELVEFLYECVEDGESGLVEKARDMGATWVCVAFSVWLWLYRPGAAVGWGSRKEVLVDRLGDLDSIFEKMRMFIRKLPKDLFWPKGFTEDHMTYMKIINPENGATITGEGGDNIGRGGRKLIYFKDESAHYAHPEAIEAALGDNTRVQIDISSVHGLGTLFNRKREAGVEWFAGDRVAPGRTRVFVMDWRDHPAKDQKWYDQRREKAKNEGTLHLFAQEVDRDYASSVIGTIIKLEWIRSAIDAHKKLPWLPSGGRNIAGLDVADGGGDLNGFAMRQGVVLRSAQEWAAEDVGATARNAANLCRGMGEVDVEYDCIGIGAGVKAETNSLIDRQLMPYNIRFHPWNAASSPNHPKSRLNENDAESPLIGDFYKNIKAQAWWELARRLERTHRAVTEGMRYDPDTLMSIDSATIGPAMLRQIEKELTQVTAKTTADLKLVVNKKPDGTKSPNVGDAIVMAYNPAVEEGVAVARTGRSARAA